MTEVKRLLKRLVVKKRTEEETYLRMKMGGQGAENVTEGPQVAEDADDCLELLMTRGGGSPQQQPV
jgi:hypothetical protein